MSFRFEIISGPMFSGKTSELHRRLRRLTIANKRVMVFKPKIDNRYGESYTVSHDGNRYDCIPVEFAADILNTVRVHEARDNKFDVVGIDEIQFFDDSIVDIVQQIVSSGTFVIGAGLNQDYLGRPFGCVGSLLAMADCVHSLYAVCTMCGLDATKTHRVSKSNELVLIGEKDSYTALCTGCYYSVMNSGV